jgi:phosphatidylglycerol:prolipoprotein diacylglycerol transferase
MIPYIKVPDFHIWKLPLHPFGVLVATGVIIGTILAMSRGRKRGFDLDKLNSFITWMLAMGFIGGHMLDSIFYHPDEVARRPWSLLMLWEGLSSFGGFVGGLIGVLIWKFLEWEPVFTIPAVRLAGIDIIAATSFYVPRVRTKSLPILPFCDLILSVYPVAWVFGRSGCSSVHDHPGALTDSWLGVAYPSPRPQIADGPGAHTDIGPITFIHGHYPRFDLGLLELMFTICLAVAFALTWRKKLQTGTYVVATALAYGPVRFAMDFLRIRDEDGADPRYGSFTPAQWCCIALTTFGVILFFYMREQKKRGIDPAEDLRAFAVPAAPSADASPSAA